MKYSIKDLMKALTHMQEQAKAAIVDMDITEQGRVELSAWDAHNKHIKITVYRAVDDNSGTMAPEITETKKL